MGSFSFRYLHCDSCRTQIRFPEVAFAYTDATSPDAVAERNATCEKMRLHPIWCRACNAPSFTEHVPSLKDFALTIRILRDPEGRMPNAPDCPEVDHELLQLGQSEGIEAVQRLGERLINRTSRKQCLMCGSSSITSITDDESAASLLHAECGGALRDRWTLSAGVPRYVGPIVNVDRYFDWHGTFLWAIKYTSTRTDGAWTHEWAVEQVERCG